MFHYLVPQLPGPWSWYPTLHPRPRNVGAKDGSRHQWTMTGNGGNNLNDVDGKDLKDMNGGQDLENNYKKYTNVTEKS